MPEYLVISVHSTFLLQRQKMDCRFYCLICTDSALFLPQSATISLGLIGAGTNNARIGGMLRNLSSYYYKDPSLLFCVSTYPLSVVLLEIFILLNILMLPSFLTMF